MAIRKNSGEETLNQPITNIMTNTPTAMLSRANILKFFILVIGLSGDLYNAGNKPAINMRVLELIIMPCAYNSGYAIEVL